MIRNKHHLTTIYLASEADRKLWQNIKIEATKRGLSMTRFILETMKKEIKHESPTRVPATHEEGG